MKINFKRFFGFFFKENHSAKTQHEINSEHDKHADFYYTNLINSLILFSLNSKELENLAGPVFNPLTELETEIDYAFTPVCFEAIFRNKLIEADLKEDLINFKIETDKIPNEIWDWDFIDNHETWKTIRAKANNLLDKMKIVAREYDEEYVSIVGKDGEILKKGKRL